METIRNLQEANEQSRQEQERVREELRKKNENLRRDLQQRDRRNLRERDPNLPKRDFPEPFSRDIMDEPVTAHYVAPKITFT